MKKTCILFALIFMGHYFAKAQDTCSKFYPLKEGTSFEYTNYDKKGKVDGTISYAITNVHSAGAATMATLKLNYKDKKGKEVFKTDYAFSCENGLVKMDYKSLFPTKMLQQYSEMGLEMDITGSDIEIPNDLSVGQALADANVSIAMKMSGINMNMSVDRTNRKVEKKESLTTAAGTFDCYVITEDSTTKTMGNNLEMQTKTWISEGVGMVKNETYKANGNLVSRSELTKYSQ